MAEDKARAIAAEKARIEEEEANMLVGPELPAGVTQQDMGDYGGALLPGEPIPLSVPKCGLLSSPVYARHCLAYDKAWVNQTSVIRTAASSHMVFTAWYKVGTLLQVRVLQCTPLCRMASVFHDVVRSAFQQTKSATLRTLVMS